MNIYLIYLYLWSVMKTLQIGMGWFPEEVQGLNRFYYDYCQHSSATYFKGLVIGSFNVATDSKG